MQLKSKLLGQKCKNYKDLNVSVNPNQFTSDRRKCVGKEDRFGKEREIRESEERMRMREREREAAVC